MRFKVDCPHCGAMLSVPEKMHYKSITCPDCKGELEAISTETMRVTRQFIEELAGDEDDVGVTSLPRVPLVSDQEGGGEPIP